jgi:hypothetical protein
MYRLGFVLAICFLVSCSKNDSNTTPITFDFTSHTVEGETRPSFTYSGVSTKPVITFTFSDKIKESSIANAVTFTEGTTSAVSFTTSLEDDNTTIVVSPNSDLKGFTQYRISVNTNLMSVSDKALSLPVNVTITTHMDSTDKFEQISDDALLTLIQQQTFKYFWDFGHPVSGLARERNTSGDIVTSGGSGFGIMAIIAAINRQFITRDEGLTRMKTIVSFLKNTAEKFHGAFPHWMNGATGEAIAFSEKDDGADLVETSYLIQGLLSARQFFNGGGDEATLRDDINAIWGGVEWDWFRNGDQQTLYWHWSPNYDFQMNFPITGWNECLITYVLAASSPTHPIPKSVYDNGWARNGAIKNNGIYYGIQLPLGPSNGGPLFFAHYSFLGINPFNLVDAYANYWTQNVAHTLINYNYCVANPKEYIGYGESVWGLTASDNQDGYSAHSPDNDLGVISPTAAISSIPYTPTESLRALKFFYYKLGDKIWKEYGFVDAFNLNEPWFADSFLAIDQGPQIVMIENYRSGLLWNVFMTCPEVQEGMTALGFTSPNL